METLKLISYLEYSGKSSNLRFPIPWTVLLTLSHCGCAESWAHQRTLYGQASRNCPISNQISRNGQENRSSKLYLNLENKDATLCRYLSLINLEIETSNTNLFVSPFLPLPSPFLPPAPPPPFSLPPIEHAIVQPR